MNKIFFIAALLLSNLVLTHAYADTCFIFYKAKKDDPLRLHLGLMKMERHCSDVEIEALSQQRLVLHGWSLLKIVNRSVQIDEKKIESDLGEYFLKY